MPLSNDFANSRLEYLQSAIKNSNTVTAQFYPRFQRHYNEMFPFTEGSLFAARGTQENPQQPVVLSSLNAPTLEMAKENLKTLLIPYVGDQADVIITALKDTQIFYYEEHFNEIQKELLKRIKTPTSIESYLTNLKMVFNNEKNRSNLTALKEDEVKINPTFQSFFPQNPITPAIKTTPPAKTKTSVAKTSTSLPRNNLNKMMSMVRRGEVTNLRHYTNNILNTPKQDKSKNQNQAKKKRKISTSSTTPSAKKEDFYGSSVAEKALDDLLEDNPIGSGIQNITKTKKKIFAGRGIQSREIKHKKEFHKYAIDLKKLRQNILALKYLKNANNVATFNPIEISKTLKELLEHFLHDGKQIDSSDFEKLSHTEKRLLKRLYSFLKIDFDFEHDDQFQKRFEIMYGSFLAGNDNVELKKELKEHIKLAIHEAIISKQEGASMLHKLDK
jgi:hypothetical protein